jgi:hypothetical protein
MIQPPLMIAASRAIPINQCLARLAFTTLFAFAMVLLYCFSKLASAIDPPLCPNQKQTTG